MSQDNVILAMSFESRELVQLQIEEALTFVELTEIGKSRASIEPIKAP
jgi:hypothetical protein